ncbi:MAG TPA: SDR family oxidoreductase [bacterium]|nr:SDR family oxidoreductase [bacterium]
MPDAHEVPPRLEGKVALVTGASSGVGLATARLFVREGATVHGIARRKREMLAGYDAALLAGGRIVAHAVDVSRPADVAAAVGTATAVHPLDLVVLAAGLNIPARALDALTPEAWDRLIGVNLNGAFYVLHAALPRLASGATVIFIASVSARWPDPSGAAYQAAKAGMVALAQAVGYERGRDGIRFSTILPGLIDTPMLEHRPVPVPRDVLERALRPEDVASACLYLATLPPHVLVPELIMLPIALQAIGRTNN